MDEDITDVKGQNLSDVVDCLVNRYYNRGNGKQIERAAAEQGFYLIGPPALFKEKR